MKKKQQLQKFGNKKQSQQRVYECFCSKRYNSYAGLYLHLKSKHQDAFSLYKNMKLSKLLTNKSQNSFQTILKLKSPQPVQNQENPSHLQKSQFENKFPSKQQDSLILEQKPGALMSNTSNSLNYELNVNETGIKLQNPRIIDYNCLFQSYHMLTDPKTVQIPVTQLSPQYEFYNSNYLPALFAQQLQSNQQMYNQQAYSIQYQYLPFLNVLTHPPNNQYSNLYLNTTSVISNNEKQVQLHQEKPNSLIKSQTDIKSQNHYQQTFSYSSLQNHHETQYHNPSQ